MKHTENHSIRCGPAAVSLSQVSDSARTLLVGESDRIFSELVPYTGFQGHIGTSNFLFADGHIRSLKPIVTIRQTNYWTAEEEPDGAPMVAGMTTDVTNWQIRVDQGRRSY